MTVHLAFGRLSDQEMIDDVHLRVHCRHIFELGLYALPLGERVHDEAKLHQADGNHHETARALAKTLAILRRHRETRPVVQGKWMFPSEHERPG